MGKVLFGLVVLVVMLYAFIDCIQTPRGYARSLPKWLWLVLVLVAPLAGALAWLLLGRPQRRSLVGAVPRRRSAPTAPDDDPAFLRKLADDAWNRKMRERRERPDDDS